MSRNLGFFNMPFVGKSFETGMIRVKRIYEPPAPEDGLRVLVDRIWPRGLGKEAARVDLWLKENRAKHATAQVVRARSRQMAQVLPALSPRAC